MTGSGDMKPAAELRFQHGLQGTLGWIASPLWVPIAGLVLRFHFGLRVARIAEVRREFLRIRRESQASRSPLLICANHLTLIDSFIIAWALAPPWRFVLDFDSLPWNTPDEENFANSRRNRLLVYLAKCIPIRRGGSREDVAGVLNRVIHLTQLGELALLFPEGGRSRSGRVSAEEGAWGVGRVVAAIPGCRVLCVYMRGDQQEKFSDFPAPGECMRVSLCCIEPKSDARGVRRTRDLAQQIIGQLSRMEEAYFAGRQ